MNDREKLIEIVKTALVVYGHSANTKSMPQEFIADFLIENGVIVPPVKAGDTIYEIHERRKGKQWVKTISERFVHGVEICADNCMIARCGTTVSVFLSEIGKTVFLTREEAEKALKEREQK